MKKSTIGLVDDLKKSTFSIIIGILISTGLVGGSGYLLFDSQSELTSIMQAVQVSESEKNEVDLGNAMIEIWSTGWLSPGSDNISVKNDLITHLSSHRLQPQLDSSFVNQYLDWCISAQAQLATERGHINGFGFQDPVMQAHQQAVANYYASTIAQVQLACDLLMDWESQSIEERNANLDTLANAVLGTVENLSSLETQLTTLLYDAELKQSKWELTYADAMNDLQSWERRQFASIAGIATGVLLGGFFVWMGYRRSTRPIRKQNAIPKAVKKDRGTKRQK